eukprot:scaffold675826_cov69-Prasinocladus_malaysianus.AAC.1
MASFIRANGRAPSKSACRSLMASDTDCNWASSSARDDVAEPTCSSARSRRAIRSARRCLASAYRLICALHSLL